MSQRVFITGGASGLGRALAERFARAGWRVCIGDVHESRGQQTAEGLRALRATAHFLHCDVTREEALIAAREWLEREWGGVDVVVNNAGVAQAGPIDEVSIEDWRWIIDINLLGVVRGCRVFTPLFKRQGKGHFVNVASMAGLLDAPQMTSYNATKAAVVSLSETIQNELVDHNIDVTLVCPSFFKTNLAESLRTTDPQTQSLLDRIVASSPLTAEQIADQVFEAVEARRFYVLPHLDARSAWMLKRLLPRRLYAELIRRQVKRLRAKAS